jgi:hypothetical protein
MVHIIISPERTVNVQSQEDLENVLSSESEIYSIHISPNVADEVLNHILNGVRRGDYCCPDDIVVYDDDQVNMRSWGRTIRDIHNHAYTQE